MVNPFDKGIPPSNLVNEDSPYHTMDADISIHNVHNV